MLCLELQLVQDALYTRSYINWETGEIRNGYYLESMKLQEGMDLLPTYSMAWVRQQFISKVKDSQPYAISEYGLDTYPPFGVMRQQEEEISYIGRSHFYCEDCRIEDDFWDFFYEFTAPISKAWCAKNGVIYKEEFEGESKLNHANWIRMEIASPLKKDI